MGDIRVIRAKIHAHTGDTSGRYKFKTQPAQALTGEFQAPQQRIVTRRVTIFGQLAKQTPTDVFL